MRSFRAVTNSMVRSQKATWPAVPRDGRQGEMLRGQEELHAAVGSHQVIEQPEVDVPGEAAEEIEEVAVAAEHISERVRGFALVVASYALHRQVEAVADAAGEPHPTSPRSRSSTSGPVPWRRVRAAR